MQVSCHIGYLLTLTISITCDHTHDVTRYLTVTFVTGNTYGNTPARLLVLILMLMLIIPIRIHGGG